MTTPGTLSVRIGDGVLDATGTAWTVLNAPDGSGMCDGLFRCESGPRRGGQQYGEHIPGPLAVYGDDR